MPYSFRQYRKSHECGFTLVEALAALAVLTVGLVPIMMAAFSATGVADSLRNDMIASNLAQEGIEVVRAVRDTNWFKGLPAFDPSTITMGDHQVVWNSTTITAAYTNIPLKIDGNGVYNYTTGTNTIFYRKVTLTQISASEIQVISDVTWKDRKQNRDIKIESYLFDWK